VRAERRFTIDAIVILPDHLHTIWTLPDGDADYSGRWRAIKSHFTRQLRASGIGLKCDHRGEYRLWQRRFWEHTIRDDRDYQHHVNYIHWVR
jgi:putative transposase